MTRDEAREALSVLKIYDAPWLREAIDMAIEALKAEVVSREEAIQAVDKCRERKNKEIEQLREFYSQQPTIPCFAESAEAYKAWTGEEMGKTGDEINEMNKEIIKDILKMMPTAYLLEALGVSTFEELTEQADRPKVIGIDYSPYRIQTTAPSADAEHIHNDGTLEVKVPNAQKVGRVLVMDTDSHIGGGLFYPDDAVQGEWIDQHEDGHNYWFGTCNQCGKYSKEVGNYCPNCGAKMVKGGDDE